MRECSSSLCYKKWEKVDNISKKCYNGFTDADGLKRESEGL